ncbi:hypothetical protein AURDEDRAFT_112280 [Auricularia subglabra TFB-10046 SS5]|nr:hypothetical protein AURDEDRAFT_112280 [Auricularia subglabra TFB-10046 SS5]
MGGHEYRYIRLYSSASDDDNGLPLVRNAQSPQLPLSSQRTTPYIINALRLSGLCIIILLSFNIASLRPPDQFAPTALVAGNRFANADGTCKRLILYKFDSAWGFGSEFSIFLRIAALSEHLNFTVVPDTRNWIYGNLSSFWETPVPTPSGCTLPDDALDERKTTAWFAYTTNWTVHERVVMWRDMRQLKVLDELVRNYTIDVTKTALLREREKAYRLMSDRLVLPYGETIPTGVEQAFRDQVHLTDAVWRPNREMGEQIARLAARLGLGETDVTKRRPVVAVQIRLGDKSREQADVKAAGSHMLFDDVSVYFRAAQLATARLYDSQLSPPPHTFPLPTASSPKPLLVVMTAETGVLEKLAALDKRGQFDMILSPAMDGEFGAGEEEEFSQLFVPQSTTSPAARPAAQTLDRRWEQQALYKASPGLRLALSRQLIAELTVYAQMADAFVVSGNSNLGRLALLLAGEEAARSGRVRSIDVPWYPTTYRPAIFPPEEEKNG